ncbi:MAG: SPOR domain-containing protein [Gemmatimonadetes bacterium]|nr:SPOR domain-containing protein [Gemmatimonadota bacterium]
MIPSVRVAALCFLFVSVPSVIRCQEGATLGEVEALMSQGRIVDARGALETWWTARFSDASRADRQRGIWLRGKLTVDPAMAEMDFLRLVQEFPGGAFSDDALFRLGLSADLRGDLREARGFFRDLVRDYPSSPRVPDAQRWLTLHQGEIQALPDRPIPLARERVQSPATPPGQGDFTVQLGAFRSLDRARVLAGALRESGYDARLVRTPGNDLARVRIGRFRTRAGAEGLARELEGKGYEVTFATDASQEERVGNSSG